jgi:hypothetical protein
MLRLRAHNPAASIPKSEYNVVPSDPVHLEMARMIERIAAQDYPSHTERINTVYRAAREHGFHAVWISDEEVARWNKARRAAKRRKEKKEKKGMTAGSVERGTSAESSQSSDYQESSSGSDGSSKSAREEGGTGEKSERTMPEKEGNKVEGKVEDKAEGNIEGNVEGNVEVPEAPSDADDLEPVSKSSVETAAIERHARLTMTVLTVAV